MPMPPLVIDLRKTEDYSVYSKLDFEIPVFTEGDCYARYLCRVKEMHQSAKLVVQAIDALPEGLISAKKILPGLKPPKGETYGAVESARGHLGVYIVTDGTSSPYRVRWHSPSFNAVSALSYLLTQGGPEKTNLRISDIMACIASIDFIMPDVDR